MVRYRRCWREVQADQVDGKLGSLRKFGINGQAFVEKLEALDDADHTMRWKVISHPGNRNPFPGSYVNARTSVGVRKITMGNTTLVEWRNEFDTEYEHAATIKNHLKAIFEGGIMGLRKLVNPVPLAAVPSSASLASLGTGRSRDTSRSKATGPLPMVPPTPPASAPIEAPLSLGMSMLAIPPSVLPPAPVSRDVLPQPAAMPPGAPVIPTALPPGPTVGPVAPPLDIVPPAGGLLHMPAMPMAVPTAVPQLPLEVTAGGPVYSHPATVTPPLSPTAAKWDAARRGAQGTGTGNSGGSQTSSRWTTPPSAVVQAPPGHAATFSSLEQLAQAAAAGGKNTRLSGEGAALSPRQEVPAAMHAPYVAHLPDAQAAQLGLDPQAFRPPQPAVAATNSFQGVEDQQGLAQPGLVSQKVSGISGAVPTAPVVPNAVPPPPVVVPTRQEALLVPQRGGAPPLASHMQQIQEALPFVVAPTGLVPQQGHVPQQVHVPQQGHVPQPFYMVPQPIYPPGALHSFQDVQHFEAPEMVLQTAAGPVQYSLVPPAATAPVAGLPPLVAGLPPLVPVGAQQLAVAPQVPVAAHQVPGVQLAQYNLSKQAAVSSYYPTFAQAPQPVSEPVGVPVGDPAGQRRGPGSDSELRRSQHRSSRKSKSKKSSSASEGTSPSELSTDNATLSSSIVPSGSSGSDVSPKAAADTPSGVNDAADDPAGPAELLADALVDPAEALVAVPAGAAPPVVPHPHQVAASMFASPFAQFTGAPSAFADSVPSIPSTEATGPVSGGTVSSGKTAKDNSAGASDTGKVCSTRTGETTNISEKVPMVTQARRSNDDFAPQVPRNSEAPLVKVVSSSSSDSPQLRSSSTSPDRASCSASPKGEGSMY